MEKLIDKINKYQSLHSDILESFGSSGWEAIEVQVSVRWHKSEHGNLQWLDEAGTEYGYDHADSFDKIVDGCEMFYVRDNGDSFHTIFSKSMEIEDYEEFYEQEGIEI